MICAATLPELRAFDPDVVDRLNLSDDAPHAEADDGTTFLLTGVGVPCALARLFMVLATRRPERILNVGIAGAYPSGGLEIGDVVVGVSEVYGDVGFELPDEPGFRHINEAPFGAFYAAPFALEPDATFTVEGHVTRLGRGCTVNACAGTDATGRRREQLFAADFETMEGAAVAQAGAAFGVPVCEIRAISNVAARRDMRPENITRALDALTRYLRACRESERD